MATQEELQSLVSIDSLADRYRLHNVLYDGVASVVDISKDLLDNGASHTQSGWIETTRKSEWKVPSGPLYFAVLAALYDNKDSDNVKKLRKMFANDLKKYFMMTSTRIDYAHEGLDTVVHDAGYTTQRTEKTDIVGADGDINEASGFGATMKALVGIDDCHKIGRVGSWISKENPYFWRINSKPKEYVECLLVLAGDYGCFGIDASNYHPLNGNGLARGMVVRGAENSP